LKSSIAQSWLRFAAVRAGRFGSAAPDRASSNGRLDQRGQGVFIESAKTVTYAGALRRLADQAKGRRTRQSAYWLVMEELLEVLESWGKAR